MQLVCRSTNTFANGFHSPSQQQLSDSQQLQEKACSLNNCGLKRLLTLFFLSSRLLKQSPFLCLLCHMTWNPTEGRAEWSTRWENWRENTWWGKGLVCETCQQWTSETSTLLLSTSHERDLNGLMTAQKCGAPQEKHTEEHQNSLIRFSDKKQGNQMRLALWFFVWLSAWINLILPCASKEHFAFT